MTAHAAIHHDPSAAARALEEVRLERRRHQDEVRRRSNYAHFAGRLVIGAVFVITALAKMLTFDGTRAAMEEAGLPTAGMLLALAIAVELAGGALLLAGFKARITAGALTAYLALVTLLVHHDLSVDANRSFALANLAIAGGLLVLTSHGAGVWSADVAWAKRTARVYAA